MKHIRIIAGIIASTLFISVAYAALPPVASLPQSASIVSRWYLGEASGTRDDAVGSNDLTDNNTVGSAAGQFSANAASFERDNTEYLSITDAAQTGLDITGDMTFATWIKFQSVPGTNDAMVLSAKHLSTGNQRSFQFYLEDVSETKYLKLNVSALGSAYSEGAVTWAASAGTWYHVAFVYDASAGEVDFYVDGVPQGTTQTGLSNSIFNSTASFRLGTRDDALLLYDGLMQDAIIWSYELTPSNIASLYNSYFAKNKQLPIIIL